MSLKSALSNRVVILSLINFSPNGLLCQDSPQPPKLTPEPAPKLTGVDLHNAVNEALKRRQQFDEEANKLFLLLGMPTIQRKMDTDSKSTTLCEQGSAEATAPEPKPKLNSYACRMRVPSPTPESPKDLPQPIPSILSETSPSSPKTPHEMQDEFSSPAINPSSLVIISSMLKADMLKDEEIVTVDVDDKDDFIVPRVNLTDLESSRRVPSPARSMLPSMTKPETKLEAIPDMGVKKKDSRGQRAQKRDERYHFLCCACPRGDFNSEIVERSDSAESPTEMVKSTRRRATNPISIGRSSPSFLSSNFIDRLRLARNQAAENSSL